MATLAELFDAVHESVELSSAEEVVNTCALIIRVQAMDGAERDTIRAAFINGPLFDGDVPSKSARDQLIGDGLIIQIVVDGQDGYNACTYKGAAAFRLIEAGA